MAEGHRALPDLVAKIRLDSTGVDQSVSSLIGSFGKANLAMAGVAAGLGLVVLGAKSAIEIAEKHEVAERNLTQALEGRATVTKSMPPDLKAVEKATAALHLETRRLSEFDVSHKGHKMAQIDLMHRQDIVDKVTAAQAALNAASGKGAAIDEVAFGSREKFRKSLEDFITTNQRYISSQSDVIEGAAVLVRSGLSAAEAQRALGIALDISALKHIDLKDAIKLVDLAEHGRMRGLIDLGIVTKDQVDANGNLIAGAHGIAGAMDEVEKKTAKGRDTTSELTQKNNELRGHWETLAAKTGPGLLDILTKIVGGANDVYDAFDRIGKDDALWKRINDRLVTAAGWFRDFANKASAGTSSPQTDFFNWVLGGGPIRNLGPRAAGGPVLPNSVYTVGEQGPEKLVMGASGGYVIPNAGGDKGPSQAVIRDDQLQLLAGLLTTIARNTAAQSGFSTAAYGR